MPERTVLDWYYSGPATVAADGQVVCAACGTPLDLSLLPDNQWYYLRCACGAQTLWYHVVPQPHLFIHVGVDLDA